MNSCQQHHKQSLNHRRNNIACRSDDATSSLTLLLIARSIRSGLWTKFCFMCVLSIIFCECMNIMYSFAWLLPRSRNRNQFYHQHHWMFFHSIQQRKRIKERANVKACICLHIYLCWNKVKKKIRIILWYILRWSTTLPLWFHKLVFILFYSGK